MARRHSLVVLIISMLLRNPLRKLLLLVVAGLLILVVLCRRSSPQRFLTVSDLSNPPPTNATDTHRIPRIIHQTWKTAEIPERWNRTVESVRQMHAGQFEYRLWTNDDMHRFVQQEEPELYRTTFLTYALDIQRVDAFRYVILHRLGGVYIDMDNGCRLSFETLFDALEQLDARSKHLAAFPRTSPCGVSNGFMIATKNHPLFARLISRLPLFNHNYLIDYLTVMLSAGPTYLSINEFFFDTVREQASIRILDEIVYSDVYTWHTPGNSWHGRDALVILYIYRFLRTYLVSIVYGLLCAIACIGLTLLYRRRVRRSRTKLSL